MKWTSAAAALVLAAALSQGARAQETPAQRSYESVLRHMIQLPQPQALDYTATVTSRNGSFLLGRDTASGDAQFGFALGGEPQPLSVHVREREGQPATEIALERPALTEHPLLDASWRGALSWMRFGFDGPSSGEPPSQAATAARATVAPIVAVVHAIGTASYDVEDRGPASCADGRRGYHVRLRARRDADLHPATDAVLDLQSQLICTLRFELRPGQFLHVPGSVELHYSAAGPYVVATDAHIEFWGTIHHVGRNHLDIFVRYTDFST